MVFLNGLFLVAFLLSALVQINDPDPYLWVAMYLAAAAMCVAHYGKKLPAWLPALLAISSGIWILTLLPAVVGQVSFTELFESLSMRTKAIEEAREIGGLALVTLWSGVLWAKSPRGR